MNLKISWIKSANDNKSFKIFKNLGLDVFELEDLETTDSKISDLIKENYNTIVISNELASFSTDIIKKYNNTENINIIIAPK